MPIIVSLEVILLYRVDELALAELCGMWQRDV